MPLPGFIAAHLVIATATAGDLHLESDGAPLFVEREGRVLGATPLVLPDVEGDVRVSFRTSPFGSAAFSGSVTVPTEGSVRAVASAARLRIEVAAPVEPLSGTGDLFVDAGEPARLALDGRPVASEAPSMLRGIAAGEHLVEAWSDCGHVSARVAVVPGSIARAELTLEAGAGALEVTGTPVGALVFLDDVEVGTLPWRSEDLTCGAHRLDVRAPGFLKASRGVTLRAQDVAQVQVALQAEVFGSLVVDVEPVAATITVDGLVVGAGPRTVDQVAPGQHAVEATLDGYRTLRTRALVQPDEPSRVELRLEPRATRARLAANIGVTAVGVAAGLLAGVEFVRADQAFDAYVAEPDDEVAARIFDEQVRPRQYAAWGLGALAAAGLGGGTALWLVDGGGGLTINGRF